MFPSQAPHLRPPAQLTDTPTSFSTLHATNSDVKKSEACTHNLLDDGLDECREGEPLVGLRVPDVLAEDGDGLGVGLGLEVVASLFEHEFELLV